MNSAAAHLVPPAQHQQQHIAVVASAFKTAEQCQEQLIRTGTEFYGAIQDEVTTKEGQQYLAELYRQIGQDLANYRDASQREALTGT